MAVDYATKKVLEMLAARGGKAMHEGTPEEARALMAGSAALAGPGPAMRRVDDVLIPGPDGVKIPARVLVPPQPTQGLLVYLHGGGWVVGSVDGYDTMARKLAERTACTVVLVDYRLAPEHRYPAAVEDSWAALLWAEEHRVDLVDRASAPLIIAGDSAGGNLAAILAVRARDRGGPSLALQVLVYPVTDCDLDRGSYHEPENQLALTRDSMVWFWDHYVPDPARRAEPEASPLRTPDVSGLPPAVVLTAEHDVLRDEGEAYAERLRQAGVPVESTRHSGQMHGFFSFLMLPGSERGYQQVVKAVRRCIVQAGRAASAAAARP